MACDWFKAIAPPFPEFVTDKPWIVTGKLFDILKFHWFFLPFLKGSNPTEFCQSLFSHFFEIIIFFRFFSSRPQVNSAFLHQASRQRKYWKPELPVLFFLKAYKFLSKNAKIAIEINNWLQNWAKFDHSTYAESQLDDK